MVFGGLVASGNIRMPDNSALPPELQQGMARAKGAFDMLASLYGNSNLENDLIEFLPINEIKTLQSQHGANIDFAQAAVYLRDNNVVNTVKTSFTDLLKSVSSEYIITMALPERSG